MQITQQHVDYNVQTKGPLYQLWHGHWSSSDYKAGSGGYPKGGEGLVEASALLSIIKASGPCFRFLELGAGWGRQSLAITGIINNLKIGGPSYRGLAIEAEPQHYKWLVEGFVRNKISVTPVYGAVSDTCGWPMFQTGRPDTWYGQSLVGEGDLQVPQYSLDHLARTFGFDGPLDLIHMDVQSVEVEVLTGGPKTKANAKYIYIGLHSNSFIDPIINLCPEHKPVIIARKGETTVVPGFKEPVHCPSDGIILLERKCT